jgi:activator of HSP90 ATPase
MRSIIRQSVVLPAPAEELFEMYLDPQSHQAITGARVKIGKRPGSLFSAFDGALSGKMLAIESGTLIVQSWRSSEFRRSDSDSTLVLLFRPEKAQGRINLVHLDVPDHDYDGVTKGWQKYYWAPWRRLLKSRK